MFAVESLGAPILLVSLLVLDESDFASLCFEFFYIKNQNDLAFHPGPVQPPVVNAPLVIHKPHDPKILGSSPIQWRAFFLFILLSNVLFGWFLTEIKHFCSFSSENGSLSFETWRKQAS